MAERTLYIVEHAEYELTDTPHDGLGGRLTVRGREQAARTAQRLQSLPVDIIHHSPLRRAHETAAIIAGAFANIPLRRSPLLRECFPSIPADLAVRFAHIPHAQRIRDARQSQRAFTAFCRPSGTTARTEIVVCHANLIRSIICRALQAPLDSWICVDVFHCGISIISIDDQHRVRLIAHNDTGHLPDMLRTP